MSAPAIMGLRKAAGRRLAMQWRRSMSSRALPAAASALSAKQAAATAPSARAVAPPKQPEQRRHMLNTTVASTGSTPSPFPIPSLGTESPSASSYDELRAEASAATLHCVAQGAVVNEGRQVQLEFADGSRYEVHTSWLKDSSPSNRGADFYRTSAADVWKLREFITTEVQPVNGGEQLRVAYTGAGGARHEDLFEARWLYAFAPFVGKACGGKTVVPTEVKGTGSILGPLYKSRRPWRSEVEMPKFDAAALAANTDLQVEFIERMIDPGIAMITGVGKPSSLEREVAGKPIEDLVAKIIGKFNQHPVRSTTYGVMRKTADSAKQGADYDMNNPLSMHTDHSVYHGTPGFIQFLYQAEGSVRSKVCDGLALAEYVKEHHPRVYELLTTVEMTHSSRNTLYTRDGVPRSVYDRSTEPSPFELVHTHPIIQLDSDGVVEKVVQSETKRGVCALPFDMYEEFMSAYELWTQLCEDERFLKHFDWPEGTCVVTNNWRTMHGRASVPPGMSRTMAFGYVNKILVENRYRLLKQMQTERVVPSLDSRWLTRIPNQVLERMVVPSSR